MSLPEDWTEEQHAMFSKVSTFMAANKKAVSHPASVEVSDEHWLTVCHNAGWIAAELMDCDELSIFDQTTGALFAQTPKLAS